MTEREPTPIPTAFAVEAMYWVMEGKGYVGQWMNLPDADQSQDQGQGLHNKDRTGKSPFKSICEIRFTDVRF